MDASEGVQDPVDGALNGREVPQVNLTDHQRACSSLLNQPGLFA
jgi:hypothetical protein